MLSHKNLTILLAILASSNVALISSAGDIRPATAFSVRDGSQINPTGSVNTVCGGCSLFGNDPEIYDESFVEFDLPEIRNGQVFLEFWIRDTVPSPAEPNQFLSLAFYSADGIAGTDDFGRGDPFMPQLVYDQPFLSNSLGEYFALDITRLIEELAGEQASHVGFRFFESRYETPPPPPIQLFVPQLQIFEPTLLIVPEPSSVIFSVGIGVAFMFVRVRNARHASRN